MEAGATVSSVQPKLITPIQAIVPLRLQNTAMENPKVVALVQVSGMGRVEDLVVLEATHVGLVDRAEELLKKALIDPGDVRENESVRFEMILPFLYPADLGLSNRSTSDDIQAMISTVDKDDQSLHLVPVQELDEPVSITDEGLVYKPEDEEGKSIPGKAVVEVYINHEGSVRLPRIISSTHPTVALAAIESFADLQFTIPRRNGKPAVTQVRLPFLAE
jgi:hypothetical protein